VSVRCCSSHDFINITDDISRPAVKLDINMQFTTYLMSDVLLTKVYLW
jgi:hypothetical protein